MSGSSGVQRSARFIVQHTSGDSSTSVACLTVHSLLSGRGAVTRAERAGDAVVSGSV